MVDTWLPAYQPNPERYGPMPYRKVGQSGLRLPAISLGMWHNFGDDMPFDNQRAILRRAFDLGITHFDLANNYGPPYGSAETNFGRHFQDDFKPYRDELVISSKAGWDMWPGPYGDGGSRKYLMASLDQTLKRTGLDYVDIFYSHRPDPDTPLEETMGALASIVHQGKALYAGISSYSPELTARAADLLAGHGRPAAHPPAVLLDAEPLDRGRPARHPRRARHRLHRLLAPRAGHADQQVPRRHPRGLARRQGKSLSPDLLTDESLAHVRRLNDIAQERGQSLAQMALAWALRDERVTSVLIGASSVGQLEDSRRRRVATCGSATPSSSRSTATPSTRASTSGAPSPSSHLTLP